MSLRVPICEICGKKTAKFVCQRCGSLVCEDDFNQFLMLCTSCAGEGAAKVNEDIRSASDIANTFMTIGFIWIIAMLLITIGFILMMGVEIGEGGIIIFPFPFIIGVGPLTAIIIFVLFIIMTLIIMYIFYRYFMKTSSLF